jgi:hypothetical protein
MNSDLKYISTVRATLVFIELTNCKHLVKLGYG